jgi:hypothetical protein
MALKERFGKSFPFVLGLAVLAVGRPGAAEPPAATAAGPRVRLTTAQGRLVGRLVAVEDETIVLEWEKDGRTERLDVRRPDILELEVSQRPSRRAKGAKIGLLAGLGAAVAIGVAGGESCSPDPGPATWANFSTKLDSSLCIGHGEVALLSGLVTLPVGALLGAVIAPGEKWRPAGAAELSVQATASDRGAGLQLTVRF